MIGLSITLLANQRRPRGQNPTPTPEERTAQRESERIRGEYLSKTKHYDGKELRPYEGRPGALDAYRLPSRMGNRLVYPRLHCPDQQPKEFAK